MKQIAYLKESDVVTTFENQFFRLSDVIYNKYADNKKMDRLELKINGNYELIRRFEKSDTYHIFHNELSRLMLECVNCQDKGYFVLYSNSQQPNQVHLDEYGCKANPIKEFDHPPQYKDIKTDLIQKKDGFYRFLGNHDSVFQYVIWDKDLIKLIQIRLDEIYGDTTK